MGRSKHEDPMKSFRWLLVVDGFVAAGFQECSGLSKEVGVAEYAEGGSETNQKSPTRVTYADITLSRGKLADVAGAQSRDFTDWMSQVTAFGVRGNPGEFRRQIELRLINNNGDVDKTYVVEQAWPKTHTDVPQLSGTSEDNMIESLTIVHEGYRLSA